MSERPEIADCPDAATFRQWYYLKEELVAYARANKIVSSGGKFDIADRIAHFLDTGERLKPKKAAKATSKFDWHSADLTDDTVITDSYKNTQNVRRYFKARLPGFAFSIPLMDWMKANIGKTLGEAVLVAEHIAADKKAGKKQPNQPHNQYNAFTRAYFAAVPHGTQEEVRAFWSARRQRPGPHTFDFSELQRFRDKLSSNSDQSN